MFFFHWYIIMQSPTEGSAHIADAQARLAVQCGQPHQHTWHHCLLST